MASDELGVREAIAMALGGIIGGGIYSAFGLVVAISGKLSWLAFLLAGLVVICTGYSYIKLNGLADRRGGAPTYIEEFVGNSTLAGMTGWTLLVGYIGTIALYAYAFSAFFSELLGRVHVGPVPVANLVSVFVIAAFVGLNLVGAQESGLVEDILVVVKVGIIAVFGVWGVYFTFSSHQLTLGFSDFGMSPLMAAAMSFVAFEGWQLLMYDQDQFVDPDSTIPKAIYVAIPVSTVLYMLVAITTVSILETSVIAVGPEVSLLYAALPFMGRFGAFLIGISALVSTASAINATLFSSALFSRNLLEMGLLPDRFGDVDASGDGSDGTGETDADGPDGEDDDGIPSKVVIVLGVLSAAFAVYGNLHSITSFASLAFIVIFGGMCLLTFARRDELDILRPIPIAGAIGTAVFFPLLLFDLYVSNPMTFALVVAIAVVVIGVEVLYFEREPIEHRLPDLDH